MNNTFCRKYSDLSKLICVGILSIFSSSVMCACAASSNGSVPHWGRPEMPIEAPTLPELQCNDAGNGTCIAAMNSDTLFRTGEATLTTEATAVVDQLSIIVQNRGGYVQLVGHADGQGDSASNQILSQERANTILIDRGIPEQSISACGVGDTGAPPQVDNQSYRRVDAIVSKTMPTKCPII